MDYTVHRILQARMLENTFPSPGDLPNPGIDPRSPTLQVDSLPAKPQGKLTCLMSNVSLDKLFNLTEPQFQNPYNGAITSTSQNRYKSK